MADLAWGARVSPEFLTTLVAACGRLKIADPSWLMACMAFETGETFSPSVLNKEGSGAVGLIQFMPQTAAQLGTSTEILASLTAEQQLQFVEGYFTTWRGHLHNLGDVYGAIIWPGMIGQQDDFVVFSKDDEQHPKRYVENAGLDFNHDGEITRGEIVARVQQELTRGLLAENVATI